MSSQLSVSWAGLADAVDPGDVIYLADGKIRLRVAAVRSGDGEVETEVEVGGAVASRQGLNIPGSTAGCEAVPAEDLEMLRFGEEIGVDLVALSFVRTAEDITSVRRHTRLPLIAKIEKPQAMEAAEDIIRAADCVMVARGDLGIELPIEEVPLAQKRLLKLAGQLARPSITATQMLDSMVSSPRPTRAEATDVANAIFDGTDAVMLSQETAVGQYPVETVAMMASIAEHTEQDLPYREWNEGRVRRDARDPAYTVAYSACAAARELHLAAIVTPTLSGRSARLVASHRPNVPIYALSPGRETVRRCGLMWGVRAASMRRHEVTEALIADSARRVVELGWVKPGAARRDHRGAAERAPGHDQPAADSARLSRQPAQSVSRPQRCVRPRRTRPPARRARSPAGRRSTTRARSGGSCRARAAARSPRASAPPCAGRRCGPRAPTRGAAARSTRSAGRSCRSAPGSRTRA